MKSKADVETAARSLAAKLEKVPGAVDVEAGIVESGPELVAKIDPVRAGRLGLTPSMVADQVNGALFGTVATKILSGDRQVAVRVRYPTIARDSRAALYAVQIRTPAGAYVPLASVATLESVSGTTEINREDQRRKLSVTGRLEGRDLGSVVSDVQTMLKNETLPPGVTALVSGQYQSQSESFRNLAVVLALAILLVFAVMLFQFRTFTAPLVILLVMPLSLFGVAFGLWATGTPLNVSSFMGAVMLVGIVVKNGILLLDQAQKAEGEGMTREEAVIHAGEVRLRPILMTTLTAILGLMPLALGIGAGAEMQKPLAIAVVGGLTFSTLFTLILAPLLYVTLAGKRAPVKALATTAALLPLFCAVISPAHAQDATKTTTGIRALRFLSGTGNLAYLGFGVLRPLLTDGDRGRNRTLRTGDALVVSVALSEGLKLATRERRPDGTERNSFPSGHATAAFAVAAMESHYHHREAPLWYGGAVLIAASRVGLHRHYIHDVLAGALLGYATAEVERRQKRGILVGPFLKTDKDGGTGRMVTLQASF